MANGIDILRQRAEKLNNSIDPAEVKTAYENFVGLTPETKEEKNLVRETLTRNREKIQREIIDTKLVELDSFEKKLEYASTIDMGDQIGSASRQALAAGQELASATKTASVAAGTAIGEGGYLSYEYAKDLLGTKIDSPTRTRIVSAAGGAVVVYALLKLYNWVNDKEASIGKRIGRGLRIGAIAASLLAVVGISAKDAVAAAPKTSPAPISPPLTVASAPVVATTPTETPEAYVERVNYEHEEDMDMVINIDELPEGVNLLDLTVPIALSSGQEVRYYHESGTFGFDIDGMKYKMNNAAAIAGANLLQRIERRNNGFHIVGTKPQFALPVFVDAFSFMTDDQFKNMIYEIAAGSPSVTVQYAEVPDISKPDDRKSTEMEIEFVSDV